VELAPPRPPAWVLAGLGARPRRSSQLLGEGFVLRVSQAPPLALARLTLAGVEALSDEGFRAAVERAYLELVRWLERSQLQPWRIWNYVPAIGRVVAAGGTRYELFNVGRHAGLGVRPHVAATAIGHRGSDLVVEVLAGRAPAEPVENPRQRPAYRYSRRYGPVAPQFARAIRLAAPLPALAGVRHGLVAGTASVVGEDSRHPGDTAAQVSETLRNLASVSAALAGEAWREGEREDSPIGRRGLDRYRELRVYVVRREEIAGVVERFGAAMPALRRIELACADLCRPELRVEAEGLVELSR
jgi:chorismate lyase/3-hydroxybenzoate synthase